MKRLPNLRVQLTSPHAGRFDVLAALVSHFGWTAGAEIGVWRGDLMLGLLRSFPGLTMIGVDRWQAVPGPAKNKETGEQSWADKDMAGAWDHVSHEALAFGERCRLLRTDSLSAAFMVPRRTLDFVFIDADHSTAAVKADIAAWRHGLVPGGWLLGHDADWPSVRRALAAFGGVTELPGNVWAVPVEAMT